MSQALPYDEFELDKNVKLEYILNTLDDSDIGYFLEVDLFYPDYRKEKVKNFPFAPVKEIIFSIVFTSFLKKVKPTSFTKN